MDVPKLGPPKSTQAKIRVGISHMGVSENKGYPILGSL